MKYPLIFLSFAAFFFTSSTSIAAIIIDTGEPDHSLSAGLYNEQWLAKEFYLDNDYNITGVEGFLATDVVSGIGGTFSISIYSDGGDIPDTELFTTEATSTPGDTFFHWQGTHGLNWDLSSGNYWLAFEVREGQTYFGSMSVSSVYDPVSEPEARWEQSSNSWFPNTIPLGDKGIRIHGDVAPVPLPPTVILFISGLLMFSVFRRK